MKRTQMTITFGEYDDDVYNFLQRQKNASAFIRKVIRAYMYQDGSHLSFEGFQQEKQSKRGANNVAPATPIQEVQTQEQPSISDANRQFIGDLDI